MDYFEIKVSCQKSDCESLQQTFESLGACSVTYRDAEDVAILEPAPGELPLWQKLDVTGMFTAEFDKKKLLARIQHDYPDSPVLCKDLENQVWERVWLKHFKPMKFGNSTWIIPSEYETPDKTGVNIYLDPGLAFGTGTHATTALCLKWIDENNLVSKTVMDFGCGSGILAIAALKHKAKKVYCTDIDQQAIESTKNNAEVNSVLDGIEFLEPKNFKQVEQQDVILANILAAPLMSLVETFDQFLKPQGEIIMSGILAEQETELLEAFQSHFVDFKVERQDDWISVHARKKS